MDTDEIVRKLKQRFGAQLPMFYKRRIVFWHDENHEFFDKIDEIREQLANIEIVELTDHNAFALKKLLCTDDTENNYIVYCQLIYNIENNWLLDIELYSEKFRADLLSVWLNEMNLPDTPIVRGLLNKYKKFFKAKPRRDQFMSLFVQPPASESQMTSKMASTIMAALCKNKSADSGAILQKVLYSDATIGKNGIYDLFVKFDMKEDFWEMVAQFTGYVDNKEIPDEQNLKNLATHIIVTATAKTIPVENLAKLSQYISEGHASLCYDFVSDCLNSNDYKETFYKIARSIEDEESMFQILCATDMKELTATNILPCVDECILETIMKDICDGNIQTNTIRTEVETRRTRAWYDKVACYYNGILQVANMHSFTQEHAEGFHKVEPEKVWEEYTNDYYRMDKYYRLFQFYFKQSLDLLNQRLDTLFKQVADYVEGLYMQHLEQLGENWSTASEDQLKTSGKIAGIKQQTNVYKDLVANADHRVYVIISDALRYEIAETLSQELRRERQCDVKLSSREAIFPTETKFGMAALLPHKELSTKEIVGNDNKLKIVVLADGQSTEAGKRDQVLKSANKKSIALKYDDIINMKSQERQAKVKGMEVVYIYHDKIDSAGHTGGNTAFPPWDRAITEIKSMVKIIVNEFSGVHVLITADHGFLYTHKQLQENEKISQSVSPQQTVEAEQRYIIVRKGKGADPEYMLPIKFLPNSTNYDAYVPRGIVRIKKKGGNSNFVHGGISLQEMVIPVIEYNHIRPDSLRYKTDRNSIVTTPVTLQLISTSRKISNLVFSLDFYQKDPVSDNKAPCNFELYFVDHEGNKVSDIQKVIADKNSPDGKERTFRVRFSLRSREYDNKCAYYLIIKSASLKTEEKFQIDIPFALSGFDP